MKNLIAIVVLSLGASAQNTWHVDVHGVAPGSGTAASPYVSIQQAIDAPTTLSGDTLLVQPGVYREHIQFGPKVHLVSVAGPLATIITTDTPPATIRGYSLNSSITGFTLSKTAGAGLSARVLDLSGLSLTKCIVLGTPEVDAVSFDTGSIDRCLITECRNPVVWSSPHSSGTILNSILWGNGFGFLAAGQGPVTTKYSVVAHTCCGGWSSTNITSPPLLRSIAGHDFHLRSTSPCIDAGDPNSPLDPDGSRADIGPIPFDASYAPSTVYCTAKTNSLGCVPAIEGSGNASATALVPFDITCANELNQRLGLLFYGFAPKNSVHQGGYLCVQAPVRRTAMLNSGGSVGVDDCSGVYSVDFNGLIQSGSDPLLEPGVQVFTQFWSRDPNASFTNNRSDALHFVIAP